MTTDQILDQLNAYDAEHTDPTESNIWQDIILALDEYDETGTDLIDQGRNDAFALAGGTIIRYNQQAGEWEAEEEPTSTRPDDPTWLDSYLGDVEVTDEQRRLLLAASHRIDTTYPGQDAADDREAAMSYATQVILGDTPVDDVVAAWLSSRAAERDAHARMVGALIATDEIGDDTELGISQRTGLNRQTLRKALGK